MPSNGIQYLVSQFLKAAHDNMDIMMGAANPNSAAIFEFRAAECKPLAVKFVNVFGCTAFVPIALVDTDHLAILTAYASITEKIRRVCKYCID